MNPILKLQIKNFNDLTNLIELKSLNETKLELTTNIKTVNNEIDLFINNFLALYSTTFWELKKFDSLISIDEIKKYTIFDIKLSDYITKTKTLPSQILEQIAEDYCLIRPNYMSVYNNPDAKFSFFHSMFGNLIGKDFKVFVDVQNKKFYIYNNPEIKFQEDKITINSWVTTSMVIPAKNDWYGYKGLYWKQNFQSIWNIVYSDFIDNSDDKILKEKLKSGITYIIKRIDDNFLKVDKSMFDSYKLDLMALEININDLSMASHGF